MKKLLASIAITSGIILWASPSFAGSVVTLLPPGTSPTTSTSVVVTLPQPPLPPPQYPAWETWLLTGLKAPWSPTNYDVLTVWAQSEGVVQANNPLASSGFHTGAVHCIAQCVKSNSPVYAYDTMQNGVNANINFLYGSYYDGVRAAFRADAGLKGIWYAINKSPWCSKCQHGLYPVYLYKASLVTPAPTTTTTTSSTASVVAPIP